MSYKKKKVFHRFIENKNNEIENLDMSFINLSNKLSRQWRELYIKHEKEPYSKQTLKRLRMLKKSQKRSISIMLRNARRRNEKLVSSKPLY